MESGNSSSMQSSSGGGAGGGPGDDQEYESNVGNNNYFFNTTTTNTTPPPPQLQYHSNMQHFIFPTNTPQHQPPQNNYLDSFNDQSNYQNMFWQPQSQQLLPQQPPQLGNLSNQLTQQQYIHTTTATTTTTTDNNYQLLPASTSTGTKPSTSTSTGMGKGTGVASGSGQKNPRKRTRASRRAPTTVLTTDTTNFRAMVQEFTGIPSSPFSAVASPFLSRRLTDLFTGSPGGPIRPPGLSSIGSGSGSGGSGVGSHLERLLAGSNYPFRPSAHKPQITNLPFQSLLQPGVISSSARYNSLSGSPFHELSGILGGNNNNNNNNSPNNNNQPNMLLSSTSEANASMIGIGHDHGHGGWRVANDDDIGNIITNSNNNNNESNQQQMEGTISGSGTTNYDANNNNNDDNTPASTSAQGTLGNFLG